MAKTKRWCSWCNERFDAEVGAANRAANAGLYLYCSRKCSGLARRKNRPKAELVLAKAEYDREYRAKNRATLKAKKAAYFQRTYDPEKAAVERKANMDCHVEYCRRPEYKAWKSEYDKRYRAKEEFGEFWESALLLNDLQGEVLSRATKYEIYLESGRLNKRLQRRRDYEHKA